MTLHNNSIKPVYVLITPAKNEEAFLECTIKSVIFQSHLPKKWIIVSDGSTDGTETIVQSYMSNYDFIDLVTIKGDCNRNFGSKVNAFNVGYRKLNKLTYDFIGNLDADVSFDSDYFDAILQRFRHDPKLGCAGGVVLDNVDGQIDKIDNNFDRVSGAVQLYRRECFEQIGGFLPIKYGGEDSVAQISCRKNGWKTQTFPDIKVMHYRRRGTAQNSILKARFKEGLRDYAIGYHWLFEIFKCGKHLFYHPYIIGSAFRLCGFFWAIIRGDQPAIPMDIMIYLRKEQLGRIKKFLGLK